VRGSAALLLFSAAALGAGAGRALTTTYVPYLLHRIHDAPALIGVVMTVNAVSGLVVPLAVGVWSDRRDGRGLGRRLPFMIAGCLLAVGGLIALALGTASSYVALGLAAALAYTGLNTLTTAHRALIAEDFDDADRPRATSLQELAALVGAVAAVVIGGALIEPAPLLAFAIVAAVVALTAVPTLLMTRRLALGTHQSAHPRQRPRVVLREALAQPGAREVLAAQTLWVFAYAALPAYFVLYATQSLRLSIGVAGLLPLGFGAVTAIGMLLAGRTPAQRIRTLLLAAVALLGLGLLGAGFAPTLGAAVIPFTAAAVGAGIATSLGFAYFARFVPDGQAGSYSGLFFAARAAAAAAALPIAGVAVELTGTYRATLWLGGSALLALIPLALAQRRAAAASRPPKPPPTSLAAIVPVYGSQRVGEVVRGVLAHADDVVLVDDASPPPVAAMLDELARDERVRLLRLARNSGKGSAVAAGIELLLADARPPESIVVIDSDGQHDPARIPAFLDAARGADVVIGSRTDRRRMPLARRAANRAASLALLASTGRWLADSQNGMRLYWTRTLRSTPMPAGRYEAESRHLRTLLAAQHRIASVEIPTIYEGEPSHFHALADTCSVARALLAPRITFGRRPALSAAAAPWKFLQARSPALVSALAAAMAIAALLPVLQPVDSALFLAVNALGDGPEVLYDALDPHTRNYILIFVVALAVGTVRLRPRHVAGLALALVLAGYLSGVALEVVKLFVERARPQELLGDSVQLSHGRSWAAIASFPSGHMIVTSALATVAAAALPRLRAVLIVYVSLVGITRVMFGAHFPLDVLVGTMLGWQIGLFCAGLVASTRLLPAEILTRRHASWHPAAAMPGR
jgi:membrane-associated phospholipid phosphatase/MFS family permease